MGASIGVVNGDTASMKGKRQGTHFWFHGCALSVLLTCLSSAAVSCAAVSSPTLSSPAVASYATTPTEPFSDQQEKPVDLEQLRSMLDKSGPEGKADRVSAVQQLLALPKREAHRLLHERLRSKDPDGLRQTILEGLGVHLLGNPSTQFGGADETLRKVILTGYLDACAPLWRDATDVEDVANQPVRGAARQALRRVPVRELDVAARTLMTRNAPLDRVLVLRCLADMQQTLLAKTIADQLEAPEDVVRLGAQKALQLLTYADTPIRTKADFDAWFAQFGSMRYVDLVERVARNAPSTYSRLSEQLVQLRVESARELVTVHIAAKSGIDWAAVQARTFSDGRPVLDACLQALQGVLVKGTAVDGAAPTRQAFCRALLDRFGLVGVSTDPTIQKRRALLIEVAAYLIKAEETEFANEIRTVLIAELASSSPASQVAALRGLRRFPSPEARKALVKRALQVLAASKGKQEQLKIMLETLAAPREPRWFAPSPGDPDLADWLQLIDTSCRAAKDLGLRQKALLLAQVTDRAGARVPDAFGTLLTLAMDVKVETNFRANCLIYLKAWRSDEPLAEQWLLALHELLSDDEQPVRRQAAESLVHLPNSKDDRRDGWFKTTLEVIRDRLLVERDEDVLKALVNCVTAIGAEAQMSEKTIGALKTVLSGLGSPIKPEHTFRMKPLLRALSTIAAGANTEPGQWLAACEPLLSNTERGLLRVVLGSHDAISLAKDVGSADKALVDRSCKAMRYLIEAAVLKPASTAWSSSSDLKNEARDVRAAFEALDKADTAQRLDQPKHRLVRLTVDLAAGKNAEVVARATTWLKATGAAGPQDVAYSDHMRFLTAEAQLALKQPLKALTVLETRSATAAATAEVLDLSSRIANDLVAQKELARAVEVFERTMRATATENPQFRRRLLDWMKHSIQHDQKNREATLAEGQKHAALFEAADCPAPLREAFKQLQSAN